MRSQRKGGLPSPPAGVIPADSAGVPGCPAQGSALPLVDKPIIQYAVEEAVSGWHEQVIIITSSQKRAIEDHFDVSFELPGAPPRREGRRMEMLRQRSWRSRPRPVICHSFGAKGVAWSLLRSFMAKELVGHEPFAVILSDDVVVGDVPALASSCGPK